MCLYHGRKQSGTRFYGGWKKLGPQLQDLIAFLPDPLFSVTTDLLIARLLADPMEEKAVQYLVNGHGIGSFNALPCGEWRAKWSSSFKHTEPGYSAYVPNMMESEWASHDIVQGGCSKSNL